MWVKTGMYVNVHVCACEEDVRWYSSFLSPCSKERTTKRQEESHRNALTPAGRGKFSFSIGVVVVLPAFTFFRTDYFFRHFSSLFSFRYTHALVGTS